MHYILCKDKNWIKALSQEVSDNYSKDFLTEGILPMIKLQENINLKGGHLAFSTTAIINGKEIPEDSITKQASRACQLVFEKLGSEKKINCHVYSLTHKYGILETGRAEILKEKIVGNLRKERIFCLRKDFDRSLPFVQVLILADRSIAVSVLNEKDMQSYRSLISPYVGGFNNVEDDKQAPSRAFKKIVEAQEILGHSIGKGETLVDLGASPGGWSYIARKQGAKVIALDRSPLREDLMNDEMVTFIKADAFKYKEEEAIDWVVSDIISTPDRVMELINYWVLENHCQYFIFTIKFQGSENYQVVDEFKNIGKKSNFDIILKQLNANKNEVTIMGSRPKAVKNLSTS